MTNRTSHYITEWLITDSLRDLVNSEYQERVWLGHSETEVSSMYETVAALFSESNLDEALERMETAFSRGIDDDLKKLDKLLNVALSTEQTFGTATVLASEQWKEIRELAAHVLAEIDRDFSKHVPPAL